MWSGREGASWWEYGKDGNQARASGYDASGTLRATATLEPIYTWVSVTMPHELVYWEVALTIMGDHSVMYRIDRDGAWTVYGPEGRHDRTVLDSCWPELVGMF